MKKPSKPIAAIEAGPQRWSIQDVVDLAYRRKEIALCADESWRRSIDRGAQILSEMWQREGKIYGVTTGYGASWTVSIPPQLVPELPLQLTRFHGCGLGRILDPVAGRAVLATRLCSLMQGHSGVRLALLQQLVAFLQRDIVPCIPEEGSVGASGDLTPLSYVAAALLGERQVYHRGQPKAAAEALAEEGLAPLQLQPKEGLALMNGTAMMTGLACLALDRAAYLGRLCARITALAAGILHSNPIHFDARLFAAKPFPGQQQIAAWIREDLPGQSGPPPQLQSPYSIRCAPHIIGVLADALPWMREQVEIELNSANDNPLLHVQSEEILHGGHFYGGHIAFVMDGLKQAVANLADLLDRQLALLVDPHTNQGLPANLSGAQGPRAAINHGLKALQIGASAWAAEALKLTMPASVFSRSTECHNQDKVSMGSIAARDALRVLELTEQVAAALCIATTQGVALRQRQGVELQLPAPVQAHLELLGERCPFIEEDRPLDGALRELLSDIQGQRWGWS